MTNDVPKEEADRLRALLDEALGVLMTAVWIEPGAHASALDVVRRVAEALGKPWKPRASTRDLW